MLITIITTGSLNSIKEHNTYLVFWTILYQRELGKTNRNKDNKLFLFIPWGIFATEGKSKNRIILRGLNLTVHKSSIYKIKSLVGSFSTSFIVLMALFWFADSMYYYF